MQIPGWHLQEPLKHLGVSLIEQPLPAGEDTALSEHERLIPVCADESCHVSGDLEELAGRYDFVNIKLDKTGGLTEALELRAKSASIGLWNNGWLHGGYIAGDGASDVDCTRCRIFRP